MKARRGELTSLHLAEEGGGRARGRDHAPPGKVARGGHLHSRGEAVLGPPPWTLRGV